MMLCYLCFETGALAGSTWLALIRGTMMRKDYRETGQSSMKTKTNKQKQNSLCLEK